MQHTEKEAEAPQTWDDDGPQTVHSGWGDDGTQATWDDDDGSQPVHAPATFPTWNDDEGSQPVQGNDIDSTQKAEGWDEDGAQVQISQSQLTGAELRCTEASVGITGWEQEDAQHGNWENAGSSASSSSSSSSNCFNWV